MLDKLKISTIYDDFIKNVILTEEQKKILNMVLNKETIIKISEEMSMSERTVSYEIRKIKNLYKDYLELQVLKTTLLTK